jgi:polysaccharide pyruvyl transferase WcaK-like protein
MDDRSQIRAIGLFGPYGKGNLGNEATLSAAIQNLQRHSPGSALCSFSLDPHDTRTRHGIAAYPINRFQPAATTRVHASGGNGQLNRWDWKRRLKRLPFLYGPLKAILGPWLELAFLAHSRRQLKGVDLLLIAGTGIVEDDWGGPMGFPYILFKWSLLARLTRTKVAFLSVGAGPIQHSSSRLLLKQTLARAVFRSFRDQASKALVERIGVKGRNQVYPDLAFSLRLSKDRRDSLKCSRTVVLNGLPFRRPGWWEKPDPDAYQRYLDVMTRFAEWLVQQGYVVRLVPTQLRMDPVFIQDLHEKFVAEVPKSLHNRLVIETASDLQQMIAQLAHGSLAITSRFHGLIFSFLLGIPALAVSYHDKMRELMKDFGLDKFCLDLPSLQLGVLTEKFKELAVDECAISKQIQQQVELNRRVLQRQYQEVIRL